MQEMVELPAPAGGVVTSGSDATQEAVSRALWPGEAVELQVQCLRKLKLQLFENTLLILTPARLLIIGPSFPWGWELKGQHARADCGVVNGREHSDGSRLMLVRTASGPVCLYFKRSGAASADALLQALGPANPQLLSQVEPKDAKPAPARGRSGTSPIAPATRFEEELALIPENHRHEPEATPPHASPDVDPFEITQQLHEISEAVGIEGDDE